MIKMDIVKSLNNFDLKCKLNLGNEVVALQGSSGSGKTTILDCIAGIKNPNKGIIKIDNKTVFSSSKNINLPIKDRHIGYLFQNYALFPHMTVEENILFGVKNQKNYDISYIKYITETFKIEHLKDRKPNQISGGEKQRVALARALAIKPNVLMLDEPFSSLDKDTKEVVYKEFMEYKKKFKISIILVTHNSYEAELLADRSIIIHEGVLVKSNHAFNIV
ncbi:MULTISPECIES: ATP-binding cassette domain-containing protein [Clostridium]|uniref:ATP-binding cassette domain-containing protein n=1 Tax=Clostridium sporogenes TaxID=1509 RepID=A0A7X5P7T0_CLOSG|nr:ATP-binding cassette domain-containing protein [Clostridium sporogenes]AJD33009.1 ABC transporter family protein [Clostridium botulinum Prevot_594]KRU37655.1 molybdate ABC transporter ATP-binding protein ModC [Clostridium sporogenes]MBY7014840.1 ATP-binding cassette domain-containing protein [Clostridium sporogenes]MBY7064833.1 ATP-binding cassette domain-containing protein [Clostridium sporogenes]MBY7069270.1 ATP-binding cassette domain-containing protein [Clostridium sporogenes]